MRISDWSSDVCCSDLIELLGIVSRIGVMTSGCLGNASRHQTFRRQRGALAFVARFVIFGVFVDAPNVVDSRSRFDIPDGQHRSEEHTSELQSLMRISYAVFCLKHKKKNITTNTH